MLRKVLANCSYQAGHACLGLGRLGRNQAHRLFRLTRALWPAHPAVGPWLDYMDGSRLLAQGRPEEALELLRSAARGLPQLPGIRVWTGVAYAMLGRDEEAIGTLEKVLQEEGAAELPDVWTSLAWSYLRSGRTRQALETCSRAELCGVRSPRLQFVARLALGVQIRALPVGELRDLLGEVPQGVPLLLEYARLQAHAGRHTLARAALSALPDELQGRALSVVGQASLNAYDCATALWAGHELASIAADEAQVHAALLTSEAHLREGRGQQALEAIKAARQTFPAHSAVREQLGRVLLIQGQWEAAVEEMIEALHLGGGGALAAGLAALAALELGDAQSARGVFVVQRSGDGLSCAFAHAAQVRLMVLDDSWDQALDLAQLALEEIVSLPQWAAVPDVTARLTSALRSALQAVRDGGSEAQRRRASELLGRLSPTPQIRSTCYS
ncbi:MAG: tetratricopeptide repeat protein [Armatimonadetes bacterium]|nr:tetratricopeptide repeat protein [Armatimonadota bacterium]